MVGDRTPPHPQLQTAAGGQNQALRSEIHICFRWCWKPVTYCDPLWATVGQHTRRKFRTGNKNWKNKCWKSMEQEKQMGTHPHGWGVQGTRHMDLNCHFTWCAVRGTSGSKISIGGILHMIAVCCALCAHSREGKRERHYKRLPNKNVPLTSLGKNSGFSIYQFGSLLAYSLRHCV